MMHKIKLRHTVMYTIKLTKMPPDDISSTFDFITSDERAKQTWNEWLAWTVTEDKFE